MLINIDSLSEELCVVRLPLAVVIFVFHSLLFINAQRKQDNLIIANIPLSNNIADKTLRQLRKYYL
jgi:hypothetical protein